MFESLSYCQKHVYLFFQLLYMGVVLYAPALALNSGNAFVKLILVT